MTVAYASSKIVHRTLKKLLAPWFLEHGWQRRKGVGCAYVKNSAPGCWCLWIQLSQYGDSLGGNSFTFNLLKQTTPDEPLWCGADGRVLRQLNEQDRVHGRVIASEIATRIPAPPPDHRIHDWAGQPGQEGELFRKIIAKLQTADLSVWNPDCDVWLNYYSAEDLKIWAEFLIPRLHHLLSRTNAS